MKNEQINAIIERANKLISLTANKSEIDPSNPNIIQMSEEWSLVMNVAYDAIELAKHLKSR